MKICEFGDFTVKRIPNEAIVPRYVNLIEYKDEPFLYLSSLEDCKDVANVLSVKQSKIEELECEIERLQSIIDEDKVRQLSLEECVSNG